jgi:hypothetical protein
MTVTRFQGYISIRIEFILTLPQKAMEKDERARERARKGTHLTPI